MYVLIVLLTVVATAMATRVHARAMQGSAGTSQPLSTSGFQQPRISPSRGGKSICVSGIVPVRASSSQIVQISPEEVPTNQTALTNLAVSIFTAGLTGQASQYTTVEGTFNIGASLCFPPNDDGKTKLRAVQLATHGVGLDRYYFDFAPGYSMVDASTAAGYAVLIYDRLGVGESEHPDPTITQITLQIEIAQALAGFLRNGTLSDTKFDKVIGIGHSYGSAITEGLNAAYPSSFDATVVTGISTNTTIPQSGFYFGFNPTIASQSDPLRFGGLPTGYFCSENVQGIQLIFFRAPEFSDAILEQTFAQRQTTNIGELFGDPPFSNPAKEYVNPLFVLNGENDWPYCQGNCSYPSYDPVNVHKDFYPKVKKSNFGSYLAPGTGHAVNLHFSSGAANAAMIKFLKRHGF